MQQATAICTSVMDIGFGRVRATFSCPILPRAGQFLLLETAPSDALVYRDVVYPFAAHDNGFSIEFAAGQQPERLAPNAEFDVLGAFGKAAQLTHRQPRVLLIAEQDPAPTLALADAAIAQRGEVVLLLGQPYPIQSLRPEIEVQVGHLPKLIRQHQTWADEIFVHGDLHVSHAHHLFTGLLPCGTGACQACYVKSKDGQVMACKQGPWIR